MSSPEINAAQVYNGSNTPGLIAIEPLTFTQFPVVGIQYTQDATSFCPDSASTAISLSSGYKTHSCVIGLGIDKATKGEAIADKILQKDFEKLTQKEIIALKQNINNGKISVSNETKNKISALHDRLIDRDKKRAEDRAKEDRLLKKGINLTSDDLEFLKGRKGLQHHSDSRGNEWYTRGE